MKRHSETTRIVLYSLSELIFALLPLLVLGAAWPDHHQGHPKTFWWGPEISMTACILYGLTISKLSIGAIVRRRPAKGTHSFAPMVNIIVVSQIIGVIVSLLIITKLAGFSENIFWLVAQYINLLIAVSCFIVFGGYGIRLSESD